MDISNLIFFLLLIVWLFCLINSIFKDKEKKDNTNKNFRIVKRINSCLIVGIIIIMQFSFRYMMPTIFYTIIMSIALISSSILLFCNKKNKN
jgi:Na+/H+ antiporter NhaD/arsenite permease-like protein